MAYLKLWADMHSNIHHGQIDELSLWLQHAQETMGFWPIAYYPFYMRKLENGFAIEDLYDEEIYQEDWETIRMTCKQANEKGFAMFMGYEWQGNGSDGDHNVFFLNNDQPQKHPMLYSELKETYKGEPVIVIPHHLAYQLGSRGKNWDSHDETFSPFAEIYSSHGLSEKDPAFLAMDRHVHMGPRVSNTAYERGLERGYKVGCIASGDNHAVPGTYGYGMMCALSKDRSKEAIFDALVNRRVYGVSHSRIEVEHTIDGYPMGSLVKGKGKHLLKVHVKGSDRIAQIEILRNNRVYKMICPDFKEVSEGPVTFKVRIEFGWGPDVRVFPEETEKRWIGSLKVEHGKILDIEKCFSNFHQKASTESENEAVYDLTTYQSTHTGKWMGTCVAANESLIFEICSSLEGTVTLNVNEKTYEFKVKDLLKDSHLLADLDEADRLIQKHFGKVEHYRNDPWWHNSYKIKIHQAASIENCTADIEEEIEENENCQYRLRILQENGDRAWTSPIFLEIENEQIK